MTQTSTPVEDLNAETLLMEAQLKNYNAKTNLLLAKHTFDSLEAFALAASQLVNDKNLMLEEKEWLKRQQGLILQRQEELNAEGRRLELLRMNSEEKEKSLHRREAHLRTQTAGKSKSKEE